MNSPASSVMTLRRPSLAVVLPEEADGVVGHGDEPAVGDGDAVGVAAEIGEHLLGAAEGRLGVDHPVDPAQRRAVGGEGAGLGERSEIAEEAQSAVGEGGGEAFEKEPPETPPPSGSGSPRPRPSTARWTWIGAQRPPASASPGIGRKTG